MLQTQNTVSPLPLGVELAYIDVSSSVSAAPAVSSRSAKKPAVSATPEKSLTQESQQAKESASIAHELETLRTGQGTQAGQLTGQEGVANGSETSVETRYVYELRKLLERKKIYPSMAKSMGQEGIVMVKFTLDRNGKIIELAVEKESHKLLNESAAKLIRSIEGLKPFPPEIAKSTWTLSVPVEYSLR